ncbi:hypothetical protein SAMN05421736_10851 [Evansella caseinilytica]|uniref:Uncharacterized protein n=1 Tax=Evansella caseinilytica TaxID=1503961 RepID=A0A1H3RD48_9BACI|nr:hypothetical protein SAMN05421736_10851 [Evansella caseinilytica]
MKRNIMIFISAGVLLIIFILYSFNFKTEEKIAAERLKSILGTSLYHVWYNYEHISTDQEKDLTIENMSDVTNKLNVIKMYSEVIDSGVGVEALEPIADRFQEIVIHLENNYSANGEFTDQDVIVYQSLIEEVKIILPLISDIYYVPESQEGAEPALTIDDTGELQKLKERLLSIQGGVSKGNFIPFETSPKQ